MNSIHTIKENCGLRPIHLKYTELVFYVSFWICLSTTIWSCVGGLIFKSSRLLRLLPTVIRFFPSDLKTRLIEQDVRLIMGLVETIISDIHNISEMEFWMYCKEWLFLILRTLGFLLICSPDVPRVTPSSETNRRNPSLCLPDREFRRCL